nr:ovalbumin-related protein X-like isoform X2 [Procambarus clarkii]
MRKLLCGAVLVVTLVNVVRPQCVSDNDKLVLPSTPDLAHIAPFTFDLFKQLYPPTATGNFFFCPYSIWNTLVLAYFGSAGRTRQQLQDTLRLSDSSNTLATYKALDRLYVERQANTSEYVIDLANKIYVNESFAIRDCIAQVLPKEVQRINFKKEEEAAATINQFVKNVTRGKIPTIVKGETVKDKPMVLVNAAYFKGLWLAAFKKQATIQTKFYTTPDKHTLVDMMTQTDYFRIGDSSELGATVLEMPYKGEAVSMLVLLPHNTSANATANTTANATTPLDAMLQRLSHRTFKHALTKMTYEEVNLKLPKFKIEETINDELLGALQHLGISDLFSNAADLTNFDPSGRLVVTNGIHKAVVEVNEEGSEAAAATSIIIDLKIMKQTLEFTCDRPFVFFIQDNHTNNILFVGVYRQPLKST